MKRARSSSRIRFSKEELYVQVWSMYPNSKPNKSFRSPYTTLEPLLDV
jgi:hypothetical protein